MTAFQGDRFSSTELSAGTFRRLSGFITESTGIKMADAKRTMVESRLRKRLTALALPNFDRYCDFLFSAEGMASELTHFINAVTTNKTDFFREPDHFEFLVKKAVPELVTAHGSGLRRKLLLWSAASSTGNEAYTLAMTLSEFSRQYPGIRLDYLILATDISTRALAKGRTAVYDRREAGPIPAALKKKYLLRSRDPGKNLVRIVPELRSKVRFRKLNLMDGDYNLREPMDIIFLRNVIIYFDRQTQDALVARLCRHLRIGGFLFMGHSELLHNRDFPLASVAPSVYRKIRA